MDRDEESKIKQYTWDEFYADVAVLAEKIAEKKFQSIIAVSRGGLPLGALLAQHSNIKIVETVCLQSYKGEKREDITFLKPAIKDLPNPILVDDICDSGHTLKHLKSLYEVPTAVLFYKPEHKVFKPDYYIHTTTKWVKFPWEIEPKTS